MWYANEPVKIDLLTTVKSTTFWGCETSIVGVFLLLKSIRIENKKYYIEMYN